MSGRIGVLFVCLGNICRSPLAKFIFNDMITQRGVADRFRVDSCGTGAWHVGKGADPRSVMVAAARGLDTAHVARQVFPSSDFAAFDYLIAMDGENRERLLSLGAPAESVRLMRSFDPLCAGKEGPAIWVPDPYYGGDDGFERVYDMLTRACEGLLDDALARG